MMVTSWDQQVITFLYRTDEIINLVSTVELHVSVYSESPHPQNITLTVRLGSEEPVVSSYLH